MRQIKFRAWDIEAERMVYDPYFWEQPTGDHCRYFEDWRDLEDGRSKKCLIMQFTGLTDKNGKEIYEGDILEESNSNCSRYEVVWDTLWCKYKLDWTRVSKAIQYPEWNRGINMAIIGNIYEHPHLLTI
jgi:uncharacterized phage protein (TIGR01671 family)